MIKRFKTKLTKVGGSHAITIPRFFFNQGMLNPDKEYEITIKEVE